MLYIPIDSIEDAAQIIEQLEYEESSRLQPLQDKMAEVQSFIDQELDFFFKGYEEEKKTLRTKQCSSFLDLPAYKLSSIITISTEFQYLTLHQQNSEKKKRWLIENKETRPITWTEIKVSNDENFFFECELKNGSFITGPDGTNLVPIMPLVQERALRNKAFGFLHSNQPWSDIASRVTITAEWGYGDAPDSVLGIIRDCFVSRWSNRQTGNSNIVGVEGERGSVAVGYASSITPWHKAVLRKVKHRNTNIRPKTYIAL